MATYLNFALNPLAHFWVKWFGHNSTNQVAFQVCSARADLGDELLQPQLKTRRVKVVPGMSNDSLSLKESQLKRKYCDEPGCDREYYNNTDLANHKRRAHGAEKLKCRDSDCPAQFGNSTSLSRHMWVKHGIGTRGVSQQFFVQISAQNLSKILNVNVNE